MDLAVILSICVFCSAPVSRLGVAPGWSQASGQQTSPAQAADSSTAPDQDKAAQNPPTPPQTPPSTDAAAKKSSGQSKTKAATQRPHKKKVPAASNCSDPASAGSNPASPGDPATASTTPPKCPPPKTVIHNGGTSDPAIQLTGGAAGQPARGKQSPTDQLLDSTKENLKKIEGRQLSSSQQEMLNQIHQFLEQSKAAVAAGDVERGHNLAMKAHVLSDELTKP